MKQSLKGSFLVAAPHLNDPNFCQSIVLLAEHSDQGAFGLIVNRPGALKVAKLWEVISGEVVANESTTFLGGPVESSSVFLLHTCADLADGGDPIVPGIFLGNDSRLFGSLLEREKLVAGGTKSGGELFRAFCGYSGWGEGQLERELKTGSWIVQPARAEVILASDTSVLWSQAMERQGGLYGLFARMPRNPELN